MTGAVAIYRPANGTEGMWFMDRFCDRCQRDADFQAGDGDSCSIVAATMAHQVDDAEYPREWVEDDAGPRCTAFLPLDSASSFTIDARQLWLVLR